MGSHLVGRLSLNFKGYIKRVAILFMIQILRCDALAKILSLLVVVPLSFSKISGGGDPFERGGGQILTPNNKSSSDPKLGCLGFASSLDNCHQSLLRGVVWWDCSSKPSCQNSCGDGSFSLGVSI